jgi:hypothetical protein
MDESLVAHEAGAPATVRTEECLALKSRRKVLSPVPYLGIALLFMTYYIDLPPVQYRLLVHAVEQNLQGEPS